MNKRDLMLNMCRNDLALSAALIVLGLSILGAALLAFVPDLEWEPIWVFFTALFTGVLAWSTIKLWGATKEMGDRSDRAIRTVERAYVKMSHIHPGLRPTEMAGVYLITVEVRNFGHTPATITGAVLKHVVLRTGTSLPAEPDYTPDPDWQQPKAFLVTNDQFSFTRRWGVFRWVELPDATHEVYAIGYVDYEDAFGRRYRSGYARLYKPTRNTGGEEVFPTPESRSNLVFVTQEGYNYDRLLDDGEDDEHS